MVLWACTSEHWGCGIRGKQRPPYFFLDVKRQQLGRRPRAKKAWRRRMYGTRPAGTRKADAWKGRARVWRLELESWILALQPTVLLSRQWRPLTLSTDSWSESLSLLVAIALSLSQTHRPIQTRLLQWYARLVEDRGTMPARAGTGLSGTWRALRGERNSCNTGKTTTLTYCDSRKQGIESLSK